ncbi:DUF397 domain-containing protein [Thermopolyspora sp. NPDC052614]|uniref:DUF397 domain-containing protein n=1 Tax=Thermopolyspora sp. NPDC052614 TaxID=3155682 RepID=UPI00342BFBFE
MDPMKPIWRKSSYSGGHNECVEAAAIWRRSSRSVDNEKYTEAASLNRFVALRDSKDPTGLHLYFTPTEWNAFLLEIRESSR